MFQHLLVPMDGSETSFLAADKALDMAKRMQAKVTLMHAVDPYPFVGYGEGSAEAQVHYLNAANATANKIFYTVSEKAKIAHVPIDTQIAETSNTAKGIVDAASACGADVIVMGTHGRDMWSRMVVGSVTQRVLAQTKIPVLAVRSDE
jgi:nucleotide-binding universal stress UspA family protein